LSFSRSVSARRSPTASRKRENCSRQGVTKKDGTTVKAHDRKAPDKRRLDRSPDTEAKPKKPRPRKRRPLVTTADQTVPAARQPARVFIGQAQAAAAQLRVEDPIFFNQIRDGRLPSVAPPARNGISMNRSAAPSSRRESTRSTSINNGHRSVG